MIRYASFSTNLKVDELINNVGKFTVNFSCKPFRYYLAGLFPRTCTADATLNNPYGFNSMPLITVYGSGSGTLHINNRSYAFISIPTYLEIDSDLMSCHKGDVLHNDKMQFTEFPYLEPGDNNISFTGNITKVVVLTKWRTL